MSSGDMLHFWTSAFGTHGYAPQRRAGVLERGIYLFVRVCWFGISVFVDWCVEKQKQLAQTVAR